MPYLGVRVRYSNNDFTVRLHGPRNIEDVTIDDLRSKVYIQLKSYSSTTSYHIDDICSWLADDLLHHYGNGDDVVWIQVESISNDGAMYGSSAEKV